MGSLEDCLAMDDFFAFALEDVFECRFGFSGDGFSSSKAFLILLRAQAFESRGRRYDKFSGKTLKPGEGGANTSCCFGLGQLLLDTIVTLFVHWTLLSGVNGATRHGKKLRAVGPLIGPPPSNKPQPTHPWNKPTNLLTSHHK